MFDELPKKVEKTAEIGAIEHLFLKVGTTLSPMH